MKKEGIIFFFTIILALIILHISCKDKSEKATVLDAIPLAVVEIDIQKVESTIGCKFKILKTETIGYTPLHKFYWLCLKKSVVKEKIKELADAIIRETIAKKPKTFHSFTIHFFWEDELTESVEKSRCFARANFLPEKTWLKVGRAPIDDYKSYKLTCTYLE